MAPLQGNLSGSAVGPDGGWDLGQMNTTTQQLSICVCLAVPTPVWPMRLATWPCEMSNGRISARVSCALSAAERRELWQRRRARRFDSTRATTSSAHDLGNKNAVLHSCPRGQSDAFFVPDNFLLTPWIASNADGVASEQRFVEVEQLGGSVARAKDWTVSSGQPPLFSHQMRGQEKSALRLAIPRCVTCTMGEM
jgi:hypothetical protein